jgi:group I intron endonuclease
VKALLVYKITCSVTGEIYIGITRQSIKRRWAGHLYSSTRCSTKLARAIRKHGERAFTCEHIASGLSLEGLLKAEEDLVNQYDSMENGLNSTRGGYGVAGIQWTPESKKRISEVRRQLWRTEAYRSKISGSQKKAWSRKTPEELEARRKCARRNPSLKKWRIENPRTRKPKPIRWKGKGWNMRIKTHCPHGHEYSPRNTLIRKCDGGRECITCKRATRNTARDRRNGYGKFKTSNTKRLRKNLPRS